MERPAECVNGLISQGLGDTGDAHAPAKIFPRLFKAAAGGIGFQGFARDGYKLMRQIRIAVAEYRAQARQAADVSNVGIQIVDDVVHQLFIRFPRLVGQIRPVALLAEQPVRRTDDLMDGSFQQGGRKKIVGNQLAEQPDKRLLHVGHTVKAQVGGIVQRLPQPADKRGFFRVPGKPKAQIVKPQGGVLRRLDLMQLADAVDKHIPPAHGLAPAVCAVGTGSLGHIGDFVHQLPVGRHPVPRLAAQIARLIQQIGANRDVHIAVNGVEMEFGAVQRHMGLLSPGVTCIINLPVLKVFDTFNNIGIRFLQCTIFKTCLQGKIKS